MGPIPRGGGGGQILVCEKWSLPHLSQRYKIKEAFFFRIFEILGLTQHATALYIYIFFFEQSRFSNGLHTTGVSMFCECRD